MAIDLDGAVAPVTGGANGIGAAAAQRLGGSGWPPLARTSHSSSS
jgi:NAD(P)-dependent dehydrogenase (short-subunit alcohol dehydrogenase family)